MGENEEVYRPFVHKCSSLSACTLGSVPSNTRYTFGRSVCEWVHGAAQGLLPRFAISVDESTHTHTYIYSISFVSIRVVRRRRYCCCFCVPGNGRNLCDIYDVWKSCIVHKNEEKLNFSFAVAPFFFFPSSSARLGTYGSKYWLHFSFNFIPFVLCSIALSSSRSWKCCIGVPSCTRRDYVHEVMNI